MIKAIQELFQNKQYREVLNRVHENEKSASLLELRALSALQLQKYELSEVHFKKLISQNKSSSHCYHLALASMYSNKFNQAIDYFDRCKQVNRFAVAAKINLAHCLFKIGSNVKAEAELKNLLKQNDTIQAAHFMLLNQYRKQQQIKDLEQQLEQSKNCVGKDFQWFKNYCYLLFYKKEYQIVIETIERSYSEEVEVLSLLANSYNKKKEYERSILVFKKIVDKQPDKEIHWLNLASAYSQLTSDEDLELSIQFADKCISLNQNYHQALYCKAMVLEKMSNYDLAIIAINQAILLAPKEIKYQLKLAELLNIANKNNQSLIVLNKILITKPDYNLATRLKGIIELQQQKFEQAEIDLTKALKIDNTDQRAVAYYAISKLAQNKTQEVEEFLALGNLVKKFTLDPSPTYNSLNEFNRDLEKDIRNHSLLRKEPNGLAARNGYLTDDLFRDNSRAINEFKNQLKNKINLYIEQLADDPNHHMLRHKTKSYEMNSWATWVKGDGYIDKHIHEESWISGAYYCKVPEVTKSSDNHHGYFEYGCIPNNIEFQIDKKKGYIKPEEGMLIIFPSYLYHQTVPHDTSEDRISIAFDLTPKAWMQ